LNAAQDHGKKEKELANYITLAFHFNVWLKRVVSFWISCQFCLKIKNGFKSAHPSTCIHVEQMNDIIFIHESLTISGGNRWEQEPLNTKVFAILLSLIILGGILSLAYSLSPSFTTIANIGEVATNKVTAKSGSAVDIQAAVNIVASQGGGTVYIPAGTWQFNPLGVWNTVNVPAGVNIFGAQNERFANGSNMEWNTVLVQTWDVPSGDLAPGGVNRVWFTITGTKLTRFSDIHLEGYASVNATFNSTIFYLTGVQTIDVMDFRIDHCWFDNVRHGISIKTSAANNPTRGVIDHNKLVNTGDPYPGYGATNPFLPSHTGYTYRTVDYGINIYGNAGNDETMWDSNIYDYLGHYTNYTVFIEDNEFSQWRHAVSSINGMHYVFRYNIVYGENGQGTVDGHGTYTNVGTRAMEFYGNQFLDPNYVYEVEPNVFNWRGGGGVFFNNIYRDYYFIIYTVQEGSQFPQGYPGSSDCPVYEWNNTVLSGSHYYAGFGDALGIVNHSVMQNYTQYPYPHPLVSGAIPEDSYYITVSISSPINATYSSGTIVVTCSVSTNGTTDKRWWNCKNGTSWVYTSNQTVAAGSWSSSMTNFVNGTSYKFYAWANITEGESNESTVMFSVSIFTSDSGGPPSGGVSSFDVIFYVYVKGVPVAGCKIEVFDLAYNYSQGSIYSDKNGTATMYLAQGQYMYRAEYDGMVKEGSIFHIEEQKITIAFEKARFKFVVNRELLIILVAVIMIALGVWALSKIK
jgi:hypothetical protein